MQIEDEVEFLLSNLEFIVSPETAISEYLYHRAILFVLIMINLFFEITIGIYTYRNSDILVTYLNQEYRNYTVSQLKDILFLLTYTNFAFNMFQYAFGFFALVSHRVTTYQIFNILMLVSIMLRIFMAYVNILNILMLILKCFTYIYSRYCLTLLFRVLILPNPNANNNNNQ